MNIFTFAGALLLTTILTGTPIQAEHYSEENAIPKEYTGLNLRDLDLEYHRYEKICKVFYRMGNGIYTRECIQREFHHNEIRALLKSIKKGSNHADDR